MRWKEYFICSVIGANIVLIMMFVFCGLISFLSWDVTVIVWWFEKVVEVYTTEKFRLLIASWFIFGNMIYLALKEGR
jgi:hypothetical protein